MLFRCLVFDAQVSCLLTVVRHSTTLVLNLTTATRSSIAHLCIKHETSLNWRYPVSYRPICGHNVHIRRIQTPLTVACRASYSKEILKTHIATVFDLKQLIRALSQHGHCIHLSSG